MAPAPLRDTVSLGRMLHRTWCGLRRSLSKSSSLASLISSAEVRTHQSTGQFVWHVEELPPGVGVVLSWCRPTSWHFLGGIRWWLINHFYVIGHESYRNRRNNAKYWPFGHSAPRHRCSDIPCVALLFPVNVNDCMSSPAFSATGV